MRSAVTTSARASGWRLAVAATRSAIRGLEVRVVGLHPSLLPRCKTGRHLHDAPMPRSRPIPMNERLIDKAYQAKIPAREPFSADFRLIDVVYRCIASSSWTPYGPWVTVDPSGATAHQRQEFEDDQILDAAAVERDAKVSVLRDGARLRLPTVRLHQHRYSTGDRGILVRPDCRSARSARSDPITQPITAR